MKKKSETKKDEILEAINTFSDNVEERFMAINRCFDAVDKRFDGVDKRFDAVDKRFDGVDKRLDSLDNRLTRVENTMVTKDYLDEKLMDLKGDMLVMMRKEDHKLGTLVQILDHKKAISKKDSHLIMSLEPFPRK